MIKASKISKIYDSKTVLSSLSFTVQKGEILGLIGSNGAGKSTTINILTGALAPTSGTVTVAGFDIQEDAKIARTQIGFLPEKPPLYPKMTTYEYLDFCASLKKIKHDKKTIIDNVLQELSLTEVRFQLTETLSKGFKQRLGLAGAFLGNPPVIVLDEPTSGLDPIQIAETRNLIAQKKQNSAIILSSHSLQDVETLCTQILLLDKGKTLALGSPTKIASCNNKQISLTVFTEHATLCDAIKKAGFSIPDTLQKDSTSQSNVPQNFTVDLDWDGNDTSKESLLKSLLNLHISIVSINVNQQNLEKLFLKLTKEQSKKQ